jgi:hypothetical protein
VVAISVLGVTGIAAAVTGASSILEGGSLSCFFLSSSQNE